jgi:hypothetical protein
MAKPVLPQWTPFYFGALGALTVLCFDGVLDRQWGGGAHRIAFALAMVGFISWGLIQRRLTSQ